MSVGELGKGIGAECCKGESIGLLDLKVEIFVMDGKNAEGVDDSQLSGG